MTTTKISNPATVDQRWNQCQRQHSRNSVPKATTIILCPNMAVIICITSSRNIRAQVQALIWSMMRIRVRSLVDGLVYWRANQRIIPTMKVWNSVWLAMPSHMAFTPIIWSQWYRSYPIARRTIRIVIGWYAPNLNTPTIFGQWWDALRHQCRQRQSHPFRIATTRTKCRRPPPRKWYKRWWHGQRSATIQFTLTKIRIMYEFEMGAVRTLICCS